MSYLHLLALVAPETILVVVAALILVADRVTLGDLDLRSRFSILAMIGAVGCALAVGWMLVLPVEGNFFHGMLVVNPMVRWVKVAIVLLTLLTILLSVDSKFTPHVGEYFCLILFAAVGMMLLVSAEDILMIFISLELTSLSLYILTAFNKGSIRSAEAGLKYFLFGGMAAAFTLFGLSLLYGLSGSTNLVEIAKALGGAGRLDPLVAVALVMSVIGFGFKVAAVPFHLWAPDAYEGAPVPSAALIASGSKVAGFFILAKVMMFGFAGSEGSAGLGTYVPGWMPVIAFLAVGSMILGNVAAIAQSSVRRLLAYSAIAHGGYLLLGVMAHDGPGLNAVVYYSVTYGLTTLGAFGVVGIVQQQSGDDRLENFAGLSRREPAVAFCMMVFILSLAGIPPLAGFFGKFFVFTTVIRADPEHLGLLWLVILAIGMSAVSLYYYLRVLKQIYVAESHQAGQVEPASWLSRVILGITAASVVILGCAPDILLGRLSAAAQIAAKP